MTTDKEPGSDELLASVMRKLLAGYSDWGRHPAGDYWVTIDTTARITAEEMQAIDDTAPAS